MSDALTAEHLAALRTEYDARRAAAEAEVARWEWASGPVYALAPFAVERSGLKRGRRLAKAPAKGDGAHHYGLDVAGRVAVVREGVAQPDRFYEQFVRRYAGGYEVARYSYNAAKDPLSLARYATEGDRVVGAQVRAGQATRTETYRYADGRLVGVDVAIAEDGKAPATLEVRFEYDDAGLLRASRAVHPNGYVRTEYERREAAPTPEQLAAHLAQVLERAIPRVVAGAGVAEPAYCLALVYENDASAALPPLLGVGLASERDALASGGKAAAARLWNPAHFARYDEPALQLDDPDLLPACRALNLAMAEAGSAAPARKLLNEVAAALNARDWSAVLPVADDFVVYATDLGGADTRKNLEAALPPERVKALKAAGRLPA